MWNFTPPEINSNSDTKISHLEGHPRNIQWIQNFRRCFRNCLHRMLFVHEFSLNLLQILNNFYLAFWFPSWAGQKQHQKPYFVFWDRLWYLRVVSFAPNTRSYIQQALTNYLLIVNRHWVCAKHTKYLAPGACPYYLTHQQYLCHCGYECCLHIIGEQSESTQPGSHCW